MKIPAYTHVISDTHFFHEKIIALGQRPFSSVAEMNETLIARWNQVVPEEGVVLHLGDFSHDDVPAEQLREIRSRLNGDVHLTLGNHDDLETLIGGEVFTPDRVRFWFRTPDKDVVFSHMPLEPDLLYTGRVSVHGHTHGPDSFLDPVLHAGVISMNCELHDYRPVARRDLDVMIADARLNAKRFGYPKH